MLSQYIWSKQQPPSGDWTTEVARMVSEQVDGYWRGMGCAITGYENTSLDKIDSFNKYSPVKIPTPPLYGTESIHLLNKFCNSF
jgi:hypothetical protein